MNRTGKGAGSGFFHQPVGGLNAANSKQAHGAICRFLWSCGYKVTSTETIDGWTKCAVMTRAGTPLPNNPIKWVRPNVGRPGYEVRSEDPMHPSEPR